MNIETIKQITKSTITVTIISTIIALAVANVGGNYVTSFALAFCFQYILFSFVANLINSYFKQKTFQKELDSLESLSTILQCAYCNHQNIMTFIPDDLESSSFSCTNCNKNNSVKIQFVVARQTDMLQLPVSSKGVSLKDKDLIDDNE
jgi:hypothetical protein